MTKIAFEAGHFSGVSECGRVEYHTANEASGYVKIDGRWANRFGYRDGGEVSLADWALACEVMRDVDGALNARRELSRKAAEAAQDARDAALDGIENVRGGAYDANTW